MNHFKSLSNHAFIFETLSSSGSSDLTGNIDALLSSGDFTRRRDILTLSFLPSTRPQSDYNYLIGFIRGMIQSSEDLGGYIFGVATVPLYGFINTIYIADLVAYINGVFAKDLYGDISPVPPEDLYATIKSFKYKVLYGLIKGVEPVDLLGFIRGTEQSYEDLIGSFTAIGEYAELQGSVLGIALQDLIGVIKSYKFDDLLGTISGYTPSDLEGVINAVYFKDLRGGIIGKMYEVPFDLKAFIRSTQQDTADLVAVIKGIGSGVEDLLGSVDPIAPSDLYGWIGVHLPEDLLGIIYPVRNRRVFDRIQLDVGPSKDLIGIFNPVGGFVDLRATIAGIGSQSSDLYGTIDGYGISDLIGIFNVHPTAALYGTISSKSIETINHLYGTWNVVYSEPLYGYINPNNNASLLTGTINPKGEATTLFGTIRPDVAFFHDTIVLNTIMHSDLRGVIYSGTACDPASAWNALYAFIRPMETTLEGDGIEDTYLTGTITPKPYSTLLYGSITGGYSFPGTADLSGYINPTGSYDGLLGTIYSPISYLAGVIKGIGSGSNDLEGTMNIFEWNVFLKGTITPRRLFPKNLNTVSTVPFKKRLEANLLETIRIKFQQQGYEYVRSDLLDNTFLVDGNTWGVRLSIQRPKINPSGYVQEYIEYKVKTFFDISDFGSFDEAMRYFIHCIAYGLSSDLSGTIVGTGGFSDLSGYIIATDPNKVNYLKGTMYPVDLDMVTFKGTINGTGGYIDLRAVIKSVTHVAEDIEGQIYGFAQNDLIGTINL